MDSTGKLNIFQAGCLAAIACCAVTSCDETIHFYPEPSASLVILEPRLDHTAPLYYKDVYFNNDWESSVTDIEESRALPASLSENYEMRIIVDLYKGSISNVNNSEEPANARLLRRSIREQDLAREVCDTIHVYVPHGNYHAVAWVDYVLKDDANLSATHYNAGSLYAIDTNLDRYPLNTHHRSSGSGRQEFNVSFDLTPDGYPTFPGADDNLLLTRIVPVNISRPSGRYRLIATDAEIFEKQTGLKLSDLTIKVIYKQYVAVGFNNASSMPNKFISTYSFNTTPSSWSEEVLPTRADTPGAATMMLDYIFCQPDKESTVIADFYIYDRNGKQINHCTDIKIPLKRNRETIVRGPLLTKSTGAGSDVAIDESFEGEYVVGIGRSASYIHD